MQEEPADHPEREPDLSLKIRRRTSFYWQGSLRQRVLARAGPGTRFFTVSKRVWTGVYNDGFIHAGNLAYMALLSLFPFFIAVGALLSAVGEPSQRDALIDGFLSAVPPSVAKVLGPVAHDVVTSRQGWLLWAGGLFGLWTASSLIETVRDILHRAYKTPAVRAFWEYRLGSIGLIFGSVLLMLASLGAQVAITALQAVLFALFPQLDSLLDELIISRLAAGVVLFASIYLLFMSLTPRVYQNRDFPKWPGALLVAVWWVLLTVAMPIVLSHINTYSLTYGSLAGVMIALFFFWLVGLGVVVGAELNAALAAETGDRTVGRESGEPIREGTWEDSE